MRQAQNPKLRQALGESQIMPARLARWAVAGAMLVSGCSVEPETMYKSRLGNDTQIDNPDGNDTINTESGQTQNVIDIENTSGSSNNPGPGSSDQDPMSEDELAAAIELKLVDCQHTIQPILDQYCQACHSSSVNAGGMAFENCGDVPSGLSLSGSNNSLASKIYSSILSERMPPVASSMPAASRQASIKLLEIFIEKGAPSRVEGALAINRETIARDLEKALETFTAIESQPGTPAHQQEPIAPSFQGTILPLVNTYCVACHNSSNPDRFNLSKYPSQGELEWRGSTYGKWSVAAAMIENNLMPPPGFASSAARADIQAKFAEWKAAGFPYQGGGASLTGDFSGSTVAAFTGGANERAPSWMRRKTDVEYINNLKNLLGSRYTEIVTNPIIAMLPSDARYSGFPKAGLLPSQDHVKAYVDLGLAIGQSIGLNPIIYKAIWPALDTTNATTRRNTIRDTVIGTSAGWAAKAWGRPVSPTERDQILAQYDAIIALGGTSIWEVGYATVVAAILSSPDFYLMPEVDDAESGNTTDAAEKSLSLSGPSLAYKLAFALTDTVPDATLTSLGADGSILDPQVLTAEAQRLLPDATAWARYMSHIPQGWLKLSDSIPPPLDSLTPEARENLKNAMVDEIRDTFALVVANGGSFQDLFTTRLTKVTNQNLAQIYGVQLGAGQTLSALPESEEGGLLRRVALLVTQNIGASPVQRGSHWFSMLQGQTLTAPGLTPGDQSLIDAWEQGTYSTRKRFEGITQSTANCMSCHIRINAGGFAAQMYDGAGRYRGEFETVNGQQFAYDVTVQPGLRDVPNTPVTGLTGYSAAIAQSPVAQRRFAVALYQAVLMKQPDLTRGYILEQIYEKVRNGVPIKDIVFWLLTTDEFRKKFY